MEVKAIGKNIRVQPRKVRIVADKVRGNSATRMASVLRYHRSKAAQALRKVIESAIANAENNYNLSGDALRVSEVYVDAGPRLKRIQPRAMGRAYRIEKKTSHITVVVEESEAPLKTKNKGTQPKPRPTFGERKKKAKPKAEAAPVAVEEVEAVETAAEEPMAEAAVEETAAPEAEAPAAEEASAEAAPEPEAEAEPATEDVPEAPTEEPVAEVADESPAEDAGKEKGAE